MSVFIQDNIPAQAFRPIRFVCTSDARQRTLLLIRAYADKLRRGHTASLPPSLQASVSGASSDTVRSVAIELARDAFKSPRTYYFDADDGVPTHCIHLDLFPGNSTPDALGPRTAEGLFSNSEQLYWMFLSHSGRDELETLPSEFVVCASAKAISEVQGASQLIAKHTLSLQCSESDVMVVFGSAQISKTKVVGRVFALLFLLFDAFDNASWTTVLASLTRMVTIAPSIRRTLVVFLGAISSLDIAQRMLDHFLSHLAITISVHADDGHRTDAANAISILFDANFSVSSPLLSHTSFYFSPAHELPLPAIQEDYVRGHEGGFSFALYPCLLDVGYKSALLQFETQLEYAGAMRRAMITSEIISQRQLAGSNFFLSLTVNRLDIVATALRGLQVNISNLRKPLRVAFEGEEAVDEGGPRKEFFQLLCKELLSPDHGMFESTSTNCLWFSSDQKNNFNRREYWLVGMVIGLAVFNNVVLDVSFPMVLYKKLLGIPLTLSDLATVDAELFSGLSSLLSFEEGPCGTVEETFCRSFEFTEDIFGQMVSTELCPGGKQIPLTMSNRDEYVRLTLGFCLDRMQSTNFSEFKKGFDQVCARGLIQQGHVRPEELELLVCGTITMDFKALEATTSYDGYDVSDITVRFFWEIVHGFDTHNKRRFLKFCTGSDRVPVRGLADLNFAMSRNGDNETMLPTAHTCFNHLLLPAYSSKSILEAKLLLAIQNCEGFGLR